MQVSFNISFLSAPTLCCTLLVRVLSMHLMSALQQDCAPADAGRLDACNLLRFTFMTYNILADDLVRCSQLAPARPSTHMLMIMHCEPF